MRILHTIDSAGVYGAETMLLALAGEQRRRGDSPTVLSIGRRGDPEKPIEAAARRLGLDCIRHTMRGGMNPAGALAILELARARGSDVVHSHGYKTNILFGLLPRNARRVPIISTLHGWTAKSAFSKLGLYRFLDQRLLHRMNAVVIVNEQMRGTRGLRRVDPRRVHFIRNGITMDQAAALDPADPVAARIQALRDRFGTVVGAIGRLSPDKNFRGLVEAIAEAGPRQSFGTIILGQGPEYGELAALIAARGLSERVVLGGYVERARQYLGALDLLVIPSLTEGLPITLLEAMLNNLPVIATRVGDISDALGDLGTLVDAGDNSKLAAALLDAVGNPGEFKQRARGGAARVELLYSAHAMANAYDAVYRSVRG